MSKGSDFTPQHALAVLAAAYRQESLSEATVAIYIAYLRDIAPSLLEATVHRLVANHEKFFPTIAEIRHTAASIAGLLPPGSEEALAIIRQADVAKPIMRRDGTYAYTETYWEWPRDVSSRTLGLVRRALELVGESRDSDAEELFGWAQDFKRAYTKIAEEETALVLSDLSLAALPRREPPAMTSGGGNGDRG